MEVPRRNEDGALDMRLDVTVAVTPLFEDGTDGCAELRETVTV